MIRRRSTISIYDYPEHLNPFREERRESIGNKFRSFGQRGSSFRNAWNLLVPRSKRSQSFSRDNSASPQHGYDTWTVRRPPKTQQEAFGLPASWTIAPRRRYTPPNSLAGSPPRSPSRLGSQISVATLGTDDRSDWQGARPKKKRAPLPPTSPTGSSVTSSHGSSTASLQDGRQPEDSKDSERETLQILVSRIQQEFGEEPKLPGCHQDDDKTREQPDDPVAGTTTTHGSLRVEKTSVQVDKAFVVAPRARTPPASGDTVSEGNALANGNETTAKAPYSGIEEQLDTKSDGDHSTYAPKDDTTIHEQQVATNVFVETTSRTISSDGGRITVTAPGDDGKTSSTSEPGNDTKSEEKTVNSTILTENQSSSNAQYSSVDSKDQNDDKSDTGSFVTSEDVNIPSCEISTSECQVETVSGRYESGAFVVSTPDTASVYEDAASEEDIENPEVRTTLNGRNKLTLQESHDFDPSKTTLDTSVKSLNNEAIAQVKDSSHSKTTRTVTSVDMTYLDATPSVNLAPKMYTSVTPRNAIPENTVGSSAIEPITKNLGASNNGVSTEKPSSYSLKYQTSISVTRSNDSSIKNIPKNDKGGMEAKSGNESPLTPRKNARETSNGNILRTPVTAPRSKSSNGISQRTSSVEESESPISTSTSTPTPPPRNKPQPVPRMKRLRKLFSNQ